MKDLRTASPALLLSFLICALLAACSSSPDGEEANLEEPSNRTSLEENTAADAEAADAEAADAEAAPVPREITDASGERQREETETLPEEGDAVLPGTESVEDATSTEDIASPEGTEETTSSDTESGPVDSVQPDTEAEVSSEDDSEDVSAPGEELDTDALEEIPCLFGGLPCPSGQYCMTGGCGLALEGVCTDKPQSCDPSDQSVCACDGNTYASACFARQAGQHPIGPGPCPAIALECDVDTSGSGFGSGCDVNEYCFGGCVGEGFCKERPLCGNAPGEVQCACNGLDYATPCKLASAGKNLAFEGWCGEAPEFCGGPDALECVTPGAICDLQSCNPEAEGLCLTDLECGPNSPPECGCDDVTYVNKCARIDAGVAFKHMGECGEGSCELGIPGECGMGAYCDGDIGVCTGPGECKPAPFVCGTQGGDNVPVCGCDGVTYPSMCDAQKADVPVLKYGECEG